MTATAHPGSGTMSLPAFLREEGDALGRECERRGIGRTAAGWLIEGLRDELAGGGPDPAPSLDEASVQTWASLRDLILERLEGAGHAVSLAELRALDRSIDARMLAAARATEPPGGGPAGSPKARAATLRLRRSEVRLRRIVEANLIGVVFWDLDGGILDANEAFLRMVGHDRADLLAGRLDWKRLTPPEWRPVDAAVIEEIRRRGKHPAYEKEYRAKDGSTVPVLVGSAAFPDDPQRGVSFVLDLRERKAADRRVREGEAQLRRQVELTRTILDNAASALFLLDAEGRTTALNPAATRTTGYTLAELRGRSLHDAVHYLRPDGSPYPVQACAIARTLGEGVAQRELEETFVRKDGSFVPVEYSASPLLREGVVAGAVLEVRDLTARRLAEQALKRREEELTRVFTTSPDLLAVGGNDGHFKRTNPAFTRVLGYSRRELLTRPILDFVHPEDRESTRRELERIAAGGSTLRFVNRCLTADGSVRWCSWNASPVEGEPFFVCVGRDITEERARSEFERQLIGIVSHDLKNPLSAIRLSAAALLRLGDALDERTLRAVGRILSSADSALALTRDLLDFTRARLGTGIPIRPERVDVHEVVQRAVEEVEAAFPDRSIRLERTGAGDGEWDPGRLSQAITNLLVNALAHGAEDGTVTVRSRGEADGVTVEVHNRGDPIPPGELPHLFEPLRRGSGASARGGVGLGLFIVDQVVRAHGGQISIRSTPAEGTSFVVRLPRRPPAA